MRANKGTPPVAAPGAPIWQPPLEPDVAELESVALPGAGVTPAFVTGAVPLPNRVLPEFDPRLVYGGSQSDCAAPASGDPQEGTAPSTLAGPPQISVAGSGCATHVHVDGQLAAVVHGMVFATQEEVDSTVVVHEGGGTAASTAPPPEHSVTLSGTHVNPAPQSLATVQGTS
jgi:hypothetical protein